MSSEPHSSNLLRDPRHRIEIWNEVTRIFIPLSSNFVIPIRWSSQKEAIRRCLGIHNHKTGIKLARVNSMIWEVRRLVSKFNFVLNCKTLAQIQISYTIDRWSSQLSNIHQQNNPQRRKNGNISNTQKIICSLNTHNHIQNQITYGNEAKLKVPTKY